MSNTGTWMQRVAQDWLVLELAAGSGATALGITTGLQFLPFLLLTPFAGLIADRMPKQRLLQLTNIGMALPAAVLGVLAVTGVAEVWHVYVLALLLGAASAFDAPARQSFVSELVDPVDLTNAVGLNSASFNAARLVGPGLAGVLIAAFGGGAVATGWVILLNAASIRARSRWRSDQIGAAYDTALSRMTHPVATAPPPKAAMRTPARPGPTRRAALKLAELRPTALLRSTGSTISETNDWRAGASKAEAEPSRKART